MNGGWDILTGFTDFVETVVYRMPDSLYGFLNHSVYIIAIAFGLCRITMVGNVARPALNWAGFVLALLLAPKIPVVIPESPTAKLLVVIVCAVVMILAPSRLALYLSANDRQRRHVRIVLILLFLVLFLISLFTGRRP